MTIREWTLGYGRYVIVGATGVVVNLLVFTLVGRLLGPTHVHLLVASAAAFGVALFWNFQWDYRWTFRGRAHRPVVHHFGIFALIAVVTLALNLIVLASALAYFPPTEGQLAGIGVGSLWGFAANRLWNFGRPGVSVEPTAA